jgi:hypothetical protein
MSRVKGKLYFNKEELRNHMGQFVEELRAQGLPEHEVERRVAKHYTNTVIRKYSKEEQDRMWNELYYTIMEVDGGYWQIVNNMDYMPEFEHYRFKCLKSEFGEK